MSLRLITYDLHRAQPQSYEALFDAIKRIGARWYHPLESVWVIESELPSEVIRDRLKPFIHFGDPLLVAEFVDWAATGLLMNDVARSIMKAA